MSDAPDRLIEAALRPLAEHAERRQAGIKMLDGMLQASHPGADAMIARWEAVDVRKRRPLWRWALAVALLLLSAWVLLSAVHEAWRYKRVLGWFGDFGIGWPAEPHEVMGDGLSARDRFLLFGDISKPSKSEQIRALWDSEPDDPTYFAVYAIKYRMDHGGYPPDFVEASRRLAPDNSWFIYHAAADQARNSVKKEKQSYQAKKAGEAPAWKIVDEKNLSQALALLRQAGTQRQFANPLKEFVARRVPLLPQSDQLSRLASSLYLNDYFTSDFIMRNLAEAIAAQAWLLGEAGDADGFRQLLGDADAFMETFGKMQDPTAIEVLIFKVNTATVVRNLAAAAGKLGLEKEASRLKRINGNLEQWSEDQKNLKGNDETALQGSVLAGSVSLLRNQVKSPPSLSDADLKPGRVVEHLLVSRACSLAVWAILGLGIVALALFRFCLPKAVLCLAQRMNALLLPIDWAWILGAGILLPFGYVTALLWLTPLGGQAWGLIKGGGAVLLLANFLTLALLLLVVPVLIARWRLARRAAALGICSGASLLGWLAVGAGLAFVPLLAMVVCPVANLNSYLILKMALLLPLLLVILISLVRALAVTFTRQFSRAVVALTLIPTYACGMLLIMASIPVYQAAQARWERRDPMTELTSNGITPYESKVAGQLLQEVREVLELVK